MTLDAATGTTHLLRVGIEGRKVRYQSPGGTNRYSYDHNSGNSDRINISGITTNDIPSTNLLNLFARADTVAHPPIGEPRLVTETELPLIQQASVQQGQTHRITAVGASPALSTDPTNQAQMGLVAETNLTAEEARQNAINAHGAELVTRAQANMRHGQLHLTNSSLSERGQMLYHGFYTPNQPMNIAGTAFSDFAPGQAGLAKEHLDYYKDEFNEGANAQINPVELAPTEQGQIGIVDGHHRLAAGISLGKTIPLSINLDTEPAEAANWANVNIAEDES